MDWIDLAHKMKDGRFLVNAATNLQFPEIAQNLLNS